MAAKTMDPVASFQHLVDNIPEWKSSFTALATYASQKHAEFVADYARILAHARPKRKKSPSMASLQSFDDQEPVAGPEPSSDHPQPSGSPGLVEISPFEAGNRHLYAQANRKRKSGASMRSGASGPLRFRNKHMAVIYYDSYIQTELDQMCKTLGIARNNLRKGKNAYTASKGFQLPCLGRKYDHMLPGPRMDPLRTSSISRSTPPILDGKLGTATVASESPSGEAAFLRADKQLEAAQALCETAAHQVLRDGDCKLELENVVKNLGGLLTLAQATLETLIAEQSKDVGATDDASVNEASRTSPGTTVWEKSSFQPLDLNGKHLPSLHGTLQELKRPTVPALISTTSAPAPTTEIEVDDDETLSSIEIDIGRFRVNNPARVRS